MTISFPPSVGAPRDLGPETIPTSPEGTEPQDACVSLRLTDLSCAPFPQLWAAATYISHNWADRHHSYSQGSSQGHIGLLVYVTSSPQDGHWGARRGVVGGCVPQNPGTVDVTWEQGYWVAHGWFP